MSSFQFGRNERRDSSIVNDAGLPFIQTYLPDEYKSHVQNWEYVQDSRGNLFIGNTERLLEYDGVTFHHILVDKSTVYSLAIDSLDQVYIGGDGEIGQLVRDSLGVLDYKSLTPFIPKNYQDFRAVRRAISTPRGIVFQSEKYIFIWANERFQIKKSNTEFLSIGEIDGQIWVQEKDKSVYWLFAHNSSRQFFQTDTLSHGIASIIKLTPQKKWNWIIQRKGLFHQLSNRRWANSHISQSFLKRSRPYSGINIGRGFYTLGTVAAGLIILNSKDDMPAIYLNKSLGLSNSTIIAQYLDSGNGLWASTNYGINRISIRSPLTVFDERMGLQGAILSIADLGDSFYVGTTKGIYKKVYQGVGVFRSVYFKHFEEITDKVSDIIPLNDGILLATQSGIYHLFRDNRIKKISEAKTNKFVVSQKSKKTIVAATNSGMLILRRYSDGWKEFRHIPYTHASLNSIAEADNGDIWLGTFAKGAIRIRADIYKKDSPVRIKHFNYNYLDYMKDQDNNSCYVYRIGNAIKFATNGGLIKYDSEQKKLVPDNSYGSFFANQSRQVFRLAKDPSDNIWLRSYRKTYILHPKAGGGYRRDSTSLRLIKDNLISTIQPEKDGAVWLGGSKGLYRYDLNNVSST